MRLKEIATDLDVIKEAISFLKTPFRNENNKNLTEITALWNED